jgi:hypothetical protein
MVLSPDFNAMVARIAEAAAWELADMTEWPAAGLMLRVSAIARAGEPLRVALSFALNARADCLNAAGRDVCAPIVAAIDAAIARATQP